MWTARGSITLHRFTRRRGVWVELHTALFPARDRLQRRRLFSSATIRSQIVASTFHETSVGRLSREMQLAYVACSWVRDLTQRNVHPSFVISLFDVIYLLKARGPAVDFRELLGWLDNEMAIASLYVTLNYIDHRGLHRFDRALMKRLASSHRLVGIPQRQAIHLLLDYYLVGGRYWNLGFPPPGPERYRVRYQWEKSVMRRLRSTA